MPYLILQLFPRAPINLRLPFEGRCQGSKLVVYIDVYTMHRIGAVGLGSAQRLPWALAKGS